MADFMERHNLKTQFYQEDEQGMRRMRLASRGLPALPKGKCLQQRGSEGSVLGRHLDSFSQNAKALM
jgi:hypothetical protein